MTLNTIKQGNTTINLKVVRVTTFKRLFFSGAIEVINGTHKVWSEKSVIMRVSQDDALKDAKNLADNYLV